jgi:beta-glucosidase
MNRIKAIIIVLLVTLSLKAQNDELIYSKIDSIIKQLSLYEKTQLIHGITKFKTGSVERLGINGLIFTDGPSGIREDMSDHSWLPAGRTDDSSSYFPTGIALAATWNTGLAYKYGYAIGQEALYRKKDVVLGPGVNIQRLSINGRSYEYFGEDPYLTSRMAVAYINGLQKNGVAACIKHAIVNNNETDRHVIDIYSDERALNEIYLPAFKAAITEANVLSVMCGFNKFRGDFCCENSYVINDIIKGEFGFKGIVISDWAAIFNTEKAAKAGLDIELGTYKPYDEYYFANPLINKIDSGIIDMKVLDDKVRRVLYVMYKTNKFGKKNTGTFNAPETQQLAKKIADESIVLLKNDGILPLNKKQIKSIAVIGDNAVRKHAYGGFSAEIKAKYEITPLEGLKRKVGDDIEITFNEGYIKNSAHEYMLRFSEPIKGSAIDSTINAAVEAASKADMAIIFAGWNRDFDTESMDVENLRLPYHQIDLINRVAKVNSNTIVFIIGGIPTETKHFENNVKAVVLGWYGGMEGGNAYADMLFGDVNPSGKLPYTMPKSITDFLPNLMPDYSYDEKKLDYKEGVLVGYRYYETKKIKPQYPFGFGLSYTKFEYTNLKLDKETITPLDTIVLSVDMKNIGNYDGADVCQLYINDKESSEIRPIIELKAFDKVSLKSNETKTLKFKISTDMLKFYSSSAHKWIAEPGEFTVYVGNSSENLPLSKTFYLKGDK